MAIVRKIIVTKHQNCMYNHYNRCTEKVNCVTANNKHPFPCSLWYEGKQLQEIWHLPKILQGHLRVECVVVVVKCLSLKPSAQANSLMALMTS